MTATEEEYNAYLQSLFPDTRLAGVSNDGESTGYYYSLQSVSIFPLIVSG